MFLNLAFYGLGPNFILANAMIENSTVAEFILAWWPFFVTPLELQIEVIVSIVFVGSQAAELFA